MRPRRLVIAAVAVAVGLGGVADARSGGTLDGSRRRSFSYDGDLTGTTLPQQAVAGRDYPRPSDCGETDCDVTTLRLTVPRGRQSGRLDYVIRFDHSLSAEVALYDAADREVRRAESREVEIDSYTMRLSVTRLRPGRYTIVVYAAAGSGSFQATAQWRVNPPHRTS